MEEKLKLQEEVKKFMEKHDLKDFPTKKIFCQYSEGKKLLWPIDKVFGGLNRIRKAMGYSINYRCSQDSLRNFENLEKEIRQIISDGRFKNFPTCKQLPSYIVAAAENHHGGIDVVKEKMGFTPGPKRNKRSLMHWSNLKKEMKKITLELGFIPTKADLERIKRHDIACSLRRHWNNLEFKDLETIFQDIAPQIKESGMAMEILRISWTKKTVRTKDILRQLGKEGFYKELNFSKLVAISRGLKNLDLLKYPEKKYIADLNTEILKIMQERESTTIKEIHGLLKLKRIFKGISALSVGNTMDKMIKKGLLKYNEGVFIARGQL